MKRTILSLLAAVSLAIPAYAAGYSDGNPTQQTSQSSMMTPEMLLTMARIGGFSLSPNGKQVVYSVSLPSIQDNKAKTQLFLVNSDGSGRKALTDGMRTAVSPRWIEDGKRIAYLTVIEGEMQLVSILPDGSDQRQVTRIPGESPDTSTAKTVSNSCTRRTSNSPTKQKIATPISIKSRGVSLPILCTSIGMSG